MYAHNMRPLTGLLPIIDGREPDFYMPKYSETN